MTKQTFRSPNGLFRIRKILAFLRETPATCHQLAAKVHLGYNGAYKYLRHLHKTGEIYVKGWDREFTRGPMVAVYAVGNLPDIPKPPPTPPATKERLRRARAKAEGGETYQRMLNHSKAQKIKPRRDPAITALFGPPTRTSSEQHADPAHRRV